MAVLSTLKPTAENIARMSTYNKWRLAGLIRAADMKAGLGYEDIAVKLDRMKLPYRRESLKDIVLGRTP